MVHGNHITVSPAYGRDYKSAKAAKADWDDGKDFIVCSPFPSGQYCSCRDGKVMRNQGYSHVRIRFNKLKSFIDIEV